MARPERDLTAQQLKFVEEYLIDRKGPRAAIAAGYSQKSAVSIAQQLLRKPKIRALVDAPKIALVKKSALDAEFVIRELMNVASQEDVAQSTKVRALELLAKHLGMLEDRVSIKTDGLTAEQRAERVAILLERVVQR